MRSEFRLATLVVETVLRRRVSLDNAFSSVRRKWISGASPSKVYELAKNAFMRFGYSRLALEKGGVGSLPLRRRAAFHVAFSLVMEGVRPRTVLSVSGGLLPGRLASLLMKGLDPEALLDKLDETARLAVTYSHPPWLVKRLVNALGHAGARAVLRANQRQVVWVRVDPRRGDVDSVADDLRARGYVVIRDRDVGFLLRVENPDHRLFSTPPFRKKVAMKQDKGSVLVALLVKGSLILDAAAAPGMKTMVIGMNNPGSRIVAVDVSRHRVATMLRLARTYGFDAVVADSTMTAFSTKFDSALLDAPCSNTGAIREDPGLRGVLWEEPGLRQLTLLQRRLLAHTLELVRKRGVVVYATCSFLGEEGEDIVEPYETRLAPPGRPFTEGYGPLGRLVGRLFPHIHNTIGFFAARIVL